MEGYTEETIKIGLGSTIMLTDKYGVKWFPITMFFKNILYRNCKPSKYVNSYLSEYMRPVDYSSKTGRNKEPREIWLMNEAGMRQLLKNFRSIDTDRTPEERLRIKGVQEASSYFGLEEKEIPVYSKTTNVKPSLTEYDIFDRAILNSDPTLKEDTEWKRCSRCNFYLPNTTTYFNYNSKDHLKRKCRKCDNSHYLIKSPSTKKLYKLGGRELVVLIEQQEYEEALDIINGRGSTYAPPAFWNGEVLARLFKHIRKREQIPFNQFTLQEARKYIEIPLPKMKNLVKDLVEVYYYKKKKPKRVPTISRYAVYKECKKRFKKVISKDFIPNEAIKPIVGIMTEKGLVIICVHPEELPYAKTYQYYKKKASMITVLNTIERRFPNDIKSS